jgi:hypothetical protein
MFSNDKIKLLAFAFFVSFVTILVYLPALQNDFVNWDDNRVVYENINIKSIDIKFFKWMFTTFYAADWFPLTWLSHAIDYAIWGLMPMGHHLTSIIFHGLNTFLVVILIVCLMNFARERNQTPDDDEINKHSYDTSLVTGAVTGLLFGLHPLHVESVAWISERKDVLYSFFYLLSILSYIKYVSSSMQDLPKSSYSFLTEKGLRNYSMCLLFFTLSLMSKGMAVTLPVVLIILDFYPLGRLELKKAFTAHLRILIEKIPFIALSLALSIVTIEANQAGGATATGLFQFQLLGDKILIAFRALCFYLFKMLLPTDLAPFYPYPSQISFFTFEYLGASIMVLIITFYCVYSWRNQKIWLAAWLYYIVILIPVLGIVQSGDQAAADRYTYLSSLGPFLLIGVGTAILYKKFFLSKDASKSAKTVMITSLIFITCLLSVLTIQQIKIWKNSFILWNAQIEEYPDNYLAYKNLGEAYGKIGQYNKSLMNISKSIKLNPVDSMNYFNRGIAYGKKGFHHKAVENFKKAINLDSQNAKYYKELGAANGILGNYQQAITNLDRAISLDPQFAEAYFYRGIAYRSLDNDPFFTRDLQIAAQKGHKKAQDYLLSIGMNW